MSGKKHIIGRIILFLFLALSVVALFSAYWYTRIYGNVGFDAVLFTLFTDMGSVEGGIVSDYLLTSLLPAIITLVILYVVIFFIPLSQKKRQEKNRFFILPFWVSALISSILSIILIFFAAFQSGLSNWVFNNVKETDIFMEEYVDPNDTAITFPDEKRNLIYIYLESMETTFFSQALGGALETTVIPELYNLASLNTNLSHNSSVGGARTVSGATWTMGALVAHTSGLPLKLPVGIDGNKFSEYFDEFLPGVKTINDILADEGYYQVLMFGSDSEYGGRKFYFEQHGIDKILDLYTAYEDGLVPDGYWEWWGFEDLHLYDYAKAELTEISQKDKPFSFTMLTADTHHISGYVCEQCENNFAEQYENVYSCASRQLYNFILWLQQQDFYEDTTVVITGDHYSMDDGYMQRNVENGYTRRVYNCILNPACANENAKNRDLTTLDMFPTTIAALGCSIDGDRLGLGTNLFSNTPTLAEKMGYAEFNNELALTSSYYNKEFLMLK